MQVLEALTLFPDVKVTERLNIHYARMGEPTFNPAILSFSRRLKEICAERLPGSLVHPVLTTMMPKRNAGLSKFLKQWAEIKNGYFVGDAGLQISINSTNDEQREYMFNGESRTLEEISAILSELPHAVGRKYTLNFAWADDYETDGEKCAKLFPPDKFMVKITPIHANKRSVENGIKTSGGYEFYAPYRKPEKAFKDAGYDTLVFIPSVDEDRGMITCGNAVLMGREPDNQVEEIKYRNMTDMKS
jgi:23S rRNA (adenine2503-C2)-methyltransferase